LNWVEVLPTERVTLLRSRGIKNLAIRLRKSRCFAFPPITRITSVSLATGTIPEQRTCLIRPGAGRSAVLSACYLPGSGMPVVHSEAGNAAAAGFGVSSFVQTALAAHGVDRCRARGQPTL